MKAADLFCGAGGTSAGAESSGAVDLVFALNHWDVAIKTHSANFPRAKHVNSRLDMTHPSECPKIDLLFASPECTHHSNARGGRPMEDQKRAGAWDVAKWVEHHRPSWVVIENVREFRDWGPLHNGRPMKSGRGKTFDAWLMALRSLGYQVDHQLLNAADYGAATSRNRLFVIARKGKRNPIFPEATHSKSAGGELPGFGLPQWRAAAEVIDWSIPCPSIFSRRRPLADKTLRRIEMGLRKFVQPFVMQIIGPGMGDPSYSGVFNVNTPFRTILARNNHGVVVPYTVNFRNNMDASSIDDPAKVITAGGGHHGVAMPYIVPNFGERERQSPRTHDVTKSLPAVTGHGAGGLAVPFVAQWDQTGQNRNGVRSIDDPHFTFLTKANSGLAVPFLQSYYGNDQHCSVDSPVQTITTKDRHCIICPELAPHVPDWRATQQWESEGGSTGEPLSSAMESLLRTMAELGVYDIGFRMFENSELALAQGFESGYRFHGTKADVTKQIGNSVSPSVAKAISLAIAGA